MKKAKKISFRINGKRISCGSGETILDAALESGIDIPALYHHSDFKAKGNCRLCVVEIKGREGLASSCSTPASEGMEIFTDTKRVRASRTMNLRLLAGERGCESCAETGCYFSKLEKEYHIGGFFEGRKENRKTYRFANAIQIELPLCVDCRNCVDACAMQKINYLEVKGKGSREEISPGENEKARCILCGQCTLHCPAGAAREQSHSEEVESLIKDRNKIVVAQFAPSVRASIGEEFGLPPGKVETGQLVSALKKLGFDFVFDVSFGADVTTIVESKELLDRLESGGKIPMITSCCPSWVLYCEFYHPELIPYLTTSRSPQIHQGGIIKKYWAEKTGKNPEDITVVSIMPCTSKKYEASRGELKIRGISPVDYSLTVREISSMIKKKKIDLISLEGSAPDSPMGESGSGVIYGESGGVMESALRAADFFASSGKNKELKVDFREIRGMDGVKEAEALVAGKKMKIAIVNGIGNIEPVISRLKGYDYIEVMACPGGCIGGGGQPIPTDNEIRKKRIEALANVYKGSKIRRAYENAEAMNIVSWIEEKNLGKEMLYTSFSKRDDY